MATKQERLRARRDMVRMVDRAIKRNPGCLGCAGVTAALNILASAVGSEYQLEAVLDNARERIGATLRGEDVDLSSPTIH